MKPLLIATAVIVFQMLLSSAYQAVSIITRSKRNAALILSWLAGTVVVALFAFAAVKSVCHECLALPSVAACERRSGAIDVELQSMRIGGYIIERDFAGCAFYWHENNTGGD